MIMKEDKQLQTIYESMDSDKIKYKPACPYPDDICPLCHTKCVSACRCFINERTCENGHTWHYEFGKKVMGSTHK